MKAKQKYELASYKHGCPLLTGNDTVKITNTVTVTKDTTFYDTIRPDAKHDTVPIYVKEGVVNSKPMRLDTQYAYARAWVENGKVYLDLYQKETVIARTIHDAIKNTSSNNYYTIRKHYFERTPLTRWQQTRLTIANWVLILAFILLVYNVLRLLKKAKIINIPFLK